MAKNTDGHKKPFYKRWWFWLIVIILIVGGAGSAGSSKKSSSSSSSSSSKSSSSSQADSKITKANYDKITLSESSGTSQADVKALFGKKPESSSTTTVDNVKADAVTWSGGLLGKTVTISFENDHAIAKAIDGIDGADKITLDQYNEISNGMTEAQVKDKLGTPEAESESSVAGQTSKDLTYYGKGSLGANAIITFTNGTVSGMTQTDLK